MGAAGIETGIRMQGADDVEAIYRLARQYTEGGLDRSKRDRAFMRSKRMFLSRDAKMLKILEQGANWLSKLNDEQKSRFKQEGHDAFAERSGEFVEYQLWRNAYKLMDDQDEQYRYRQFDLYKFVYTAVADTILGPL
ncbi:MAG: hypothetical protein EBV30_09155 [Actinobacteria bacterium]|nr:hypothetical protein [Actinomycetota bacterium]